MTDPLAQLKEALASHYDVTGALGAGGMATVYLAEDLKHHRKVAIKVVNETLSASVGAARFLREIQIAAQLQHPNVLPLLDSGEAAGQLYYVMPYVDGQSLRQRIDREGELPVGEAVRILIEVTDALSHAHAHGVVHRDIKPDNIMLSGRHALVADFGVARAVSEATGSNTITTLGIALGTPSYMSPEQAAASPNIDHRADLYSVGVVAYELIAGRLPFTGASPQQVLAAHVTQKPQDINTLRPGIAPALGQAIMRCLEKRPADRWQTAGELLAALEPLATPSGGLAPTSARLRPFTNSKRWTWITAGAVAVAALAAFIIYRGAESSPSLALGKSIQLTSEPGLQIHPAISPDGKLVAYAVGNARRSRVFIRPVGGGRTFPVTDDSTGVESNPRWSPDGSQILFLSAGGVSVAPALGGAARALIASSANANVGCATWSPDGHEIAFFRADSVLATSMATQATRLVGVQSGLAGYWCSWSPDGKWIAASTGNVGYLRVDANAVNQIFGNIAPSSLALIPAQGGVLRPLETAARAAMHESPVWSHDGSSLFFVSDRDGPRDIYEVRIDKNGNARGPETRLTTGLNPQSLSLSADGQHLAYTVYTARANIWSLPIPAADAAPISVSAAKPVTSGNQVIESLSVSFDGKLMLYDSDLSGTPNIWRLPIDGSQPVQLTNETFHVFAAGLSADGRLLAYHSWRKGSRNIEVRPLDGGAVEFVTDVSAQASQPPAQQSYPVWAPDGRLVFFNQNPGGQITVATRGPAGHWALRDRVTGRFPSWSSDGRLILYTDAGRIMLVRSDSGSSRVVYAPRPGEPPAERARFEGGTNMILFKRHDLDSHASFWAIPAAGGSPRLLARFDDPLRPSNRADFANDGKRLYFAIDERQSNIWVSDVIRR